MPKPKPKMRRSNGPVIALVIGGLALLGLLAYGAVMSTQQAANNKLVQERTVPNKNGCTPSPVRTGIPGVERIDCEGQRHISDGQKVNYASDPPLSGDHYGVPTAPGFYSVAQTPERLVHSLEHGNVVIYYDQAKLAPADVDAVRAIARKYTGQWDGVVAVPRTDAKSAVIVTAWENSLRLDGYDQAKVDQFVDAFRGRGPENPVRPLQ